MQKKKNLQNLRIGGACAFWGDSNQAVQQLVEHGDVDVLVFDYLAELTMSILASARTKNAELGYATDFIKALTPVLARIAERKTLVLSNAGGMNPQACAAALRKAALAAGVTLRVAVVEGDDLMSRVDELRSAGVKEMFSGAPMPTEFSSVNAYLGAFPVVAALRAGADVVITGRCADSALALAALIHHFDWSAQDYDRLSAGSLVGHLLECTTQTTGGLYTDWWQVPGWDDMGYPIAECEADGQFVLGKTPGTGGLIIPLVAAEQTLYEVTDPANYVLPDVICDFTAVTITQAGENQVRIRGARGRAPTGTYKVSGTWHDGFRLATTLTVAGDHAIEKGRRAGQSILARARRLILQAGLGDFTETNLEVLGSEEPSYGAQASAATREVVVRIAVRHPKAAALNLLASEIAPMGTAGAAGTTGFSGRPKAQPVYRLFSFLWPKCEFTIQIERDGQAAPVSVDTSDRPFVHRDGDLYPATTLATGDGDTATVSLAALAVARSGDKGDVAHVAIIARKPEYVAAIGAQITARAVAHWFAHLSKGVVTRFDVPGVHAYNFIIQEALGGGGAASLRNDPLGKTLGQILLSHPVRIPTAWLAGIESGYTGTIAS